MFWIFMSILFIVMGAAFVAAGAMDPVIGGTFLAVGGLFVVMGIIFAVVAVFSIRGSQRKRLIAQTGIPGTATVTGMSDTGASVNDAPLVAFQFLVSVPGRPPYPVAKHLVLPRLHVGRVAPGVTLPVKVDPNDPDELLLEWDREWDTGTGPLMGGAYGASGGWGQPMAGSGQAGGFGQPPTGAFGPSGAFGPPGSERSGFGQPGPGFGQPGFGQPGFGQPGFGQPGFGQPGWGQAGQPTATFGGPPVVTSMSSTVIDATGGNDPIAMVSSDQLDQATLDRINRVLYERAHGPTPAPQGSAAAAGDAGGQEPPIDQVLDAIGRGHATSGPEPTKAGSTPSDASETPEAGSSAGATGFGLLDARETERLAAVGYTGRATVVAFQDTGIASGDDRLYTLRLNVRVDGRPAEEVRHATLVPLHAVSRLKDGATLPVRVDPLDASKLIVEWDRG